MRSLESLTGRELVGIRRRRLLLLLKAAVLLLTVTMAFAMQSPGFQRGQGGQLAVASSEDWTAPRTLVAIGSPTPIGTVTRLLESHLNNQGHVFFRAEVNDGVQSRIGLFTLVDGEPKKVVAAGDPLVGGAALEVPFGWAANDRDEVAFVAANDTRGQSLYLYQEGQIVEAARSGQSAPLAIGGTLGSFCCASLGLGNGRVGQSIDLNDARQISFGAQVLNGAFTGGLFLWSSGSVTPVAMIGQQASLGGSFSELDYPYPLSDGSVVFQAARSGTNGTEVDKWVGGTSFVRLGGYGDATSDGGTVSGGWGIGGSANILYGGRSSTSDGFVWSVIYSVDSQINFGIFEHVDGTLAKVISVNEPLPDGGTFGASPNCGAPLIEDSWRSPFITSSRVVVFIGPVSCPLGGPIGRKLYVRKNGVVSLLDPAGWTSSPQINERDQVLYNYGGNELRWVESTAPPVRLPAGIAFPT